MCNSNKGCGYGHSHNNGAMCCEGFEFNKTVEYQCCCKPIKQMDSCCPKQDSCGCNNCCGGSNNEWC